MKEFVNKATHHTSNKASIVNALSTSPILCSFGINPKVVTASKTTASSF